MGPARSLFFGSESPIGLFGRLLRRTDLKIWPSKAKSIEEPDFDVKKSLAPPKSAENDEKPISEIEIFVRKKIFGVKKSKVANRLKRVFPKFRGNRSHVRGSNERSKFEVSFPNN